MNTARILIAEDEVIVRSLMAYLLGNQGYHTTRVGNGLEAWEELQAGSYDLLVTDGHMPFLSGPQLIARIRQARLDLPVLLVSADASTPSQPKVAFLQKPFQPQEFLQHVKGLLC